MTQRASDKNGNPNDGGGGGGVLDVKKTESPALKDTLSLSKLRCLYFVYLYIRKKE